MGNLTDKLRVGILGTARIAETRMIPSMKMSSLVQVSAAAGRDRIRTLEFAARNGIPRSYDNYEELFEDPEIDIIYNALPVSMHRDWSLKAIQAGKHVLCEKSLSLRADHISEMALAAKEKDVQLWEALYYKYHPLHQKVLSLIRAGAIGEIRSIHSVFCTNPDQENIRRHKSTGGGVLLDTGMYCVSLSRWITDSEPSAVSARAFYNKEGVDEELTGILEFKPGVFGYFHCSLNSAFHSAYEIYGSEGHLAVDHGGLCAWPGEAFTIKLTSQGKKTEHIIPPADPYLNMMNAFAMAVLTNTGDQSNINDALANLRVIERLLEEAGKGVL